jgi:hypothetical protein
MNKMTSTKKIYATQMDYNLPTNGPRGFGYLEVGFTKKIVLLKSYPNGFLNIVIKARFSKNLLGNKYIKNKTLSSIRKKGERMWFLNGSHGGEGPVHELDKV